MKAETKQEVEGLSDEELRRNLVTCDFRGVDFKGLALDELIRRECAKAYREGYSRYGMEE